MHNTIFASILKSVLLLLLLFNLCSCDGIKNKLSGRTPKDSTAFSRAKLIADHNWDTKKYGFKNENLEQVIPFQYDDAESFDGDYTKVMLNERWFIINKLNERVSEDFITIGSLKPPLVYATHMDSHGDTVVCLLNRRWQVKIDSLPGINTKDGIYRVKKGVFPDELYALLDTTTGKYGRFL